MTSTALLSGHWFRLAELRPKLRGHVRIHRQVHRGEVWFVVHDRVSGTHHRFNPAAHALIRQMNGHLSLQQIWNRAVEQLHDASPTQAEVIQLLGQLNSADLLVFDVTPDVAELIERGGTRRKRQWWGRFLNPLSLRIPLWDPERFLVAATSWVRPLPAGVALLAWLLVVLPALLLVPMHWPELTRNFGERLMAVDNLWVMAIAFPLLKAAHELAHAFAVKRAGGEVHEMGLMLLMFYPVPYVDASAAHAFPSWRQRAWVGASGMAAEILIAALAFFIWLAVEPGLLRSIAYNVAVLGSVTTVIFNINPLLRYDGYYMLADWIEIPNLGQRSTRYWGYLATRYLFGIKSTRGERVSAAERRWFMFYAPLAFGYRLAVTVGIAWFIAQHYFLFGVLFAAWSIASGIALPALAALKAVFTQPRFLVRARRVWTVLLAGVVVVAALLFVVPVPYHTRVEGIVWLPEQAILRMASDGFADRLTLPADGFVRVGDAVLESTNPLLGAQVEEQQARVEEAEAKVDAAWGVKPAEAGRQMESLLRERAALARVLDESTLLVTRPRVAGRLLVDRGQDLPGRFLRKGEVVGYVVGPHAPIVRAVVAQADVDRVRNEVTSVEVRLPGALSQPIAGRLVRAVPKATHDLPTAALGQAGGGTHANDPRDEHQTTALENLFEFEVALPAAVGADHLGQRAYVSFAHPPEAIGLRWLRFARRQLLSKMEV